MKAAALALALALALAACRAPPDDGVVLWHAYSGRERAALEAAAARWTAAHPEAPLHLVAVPYDAFADKLTSAIPGGNGPDLFIYGNDRLGDWAATELVAPLGFWLDDATAARFTDASLAALSPRGEVLGLPLAVKSLALFYRTDLVATPPTTTDELIGLAPALRARGVYPLAYANADLYGHAPWLHGHGGRALDEAGLPTLATPAGAAAAAFARELVRAEVTPAEANGTLVTSLFVGGKAAMAISGPWFLGELPARVPWRVAALPTVSATGLPAAPFLGVEAVLVSARARDLALAARVALALTTDAEAAARAVAGRQVVANPGAYADPTVAEDEVLAAFRAQADAAVPMPAAPAMRLVWTPYRTALGEILAGRSAPEPALAAAQREVETYLRGPR